MALSAALTLLAVFTLPKLMGAPDVIPDTGGNAVRTPPPPVVVVKSGRVRAFEDVADAFQDNCRVKVQQFYMVDSSSSPGPARERLQVAVQGARVLVAVGQPAMEVVAGMRAHIVYALAPDPPVGAIGTNSIAAPSYVFRAMVTLQPGIRRIGVVYSPRAVQRVQQARIAARTMGIELVERVVQSGPEAIRAMNAMVGGGGAPPSGPLTVPSGSLMPGTALINLNSAMRPLEPGQVGATGPAGPQQIDAMWVGADAQLIDTQVTHFLMEMQVRWQIPVLTCTRQQVSSGALLAVDWSPDAVGRNLAWQVNHLLDDPEHLEAVMRDHPSDRPDVVINAQTARRLGISLDQVRGLPGWKILE
jgi:ABC-type uncharacterized transport system substrate-binding protein